MNGVGLGAITVAAVLALASCAGSGHQAPTFLIDETAGRVGPIQLGDGLIDVYRTLGPPVDDSRFNGFATAGKLPSDIDAQGGSFSVPGQRIAPEVFRYEHVAVMFVRERAFAVLTDAGRTAQGVGVGDRLDKVRSVYGRAAVCVPASSGGEFRSPAHCAVRVPAGHLGFGGDPIKSIKMIGSRSVVEN